MKRDAKAIASMVFLALAAGVLVPAFTQQGNDDSEQVIITFRNAPGPGDEAAIQALGGKVKHRYRLVPAIAAKLPKKQIEALRKHPAVVAIEPDVEVFALEDSYPWGVVRIGAQTLHLGGNTGSGVNVCVIDSGIDLDHPDLAANYKGGHDYVRGDSDPDDENGHGTHVAGTIAAVLNGAGIAGVAPNVNLYVYKVLDKNGSGRFSDVIAAVEACKNLVVSGPKITNNSYGSRTYPGSTVEQAFQSAYAAGVLHVAAAGNSGNPKGTGDNVSYPAKFDSVIAVAATDSNNKRASWSSTGPAVELAAPGVAIWSTYPDNAYATMSGTSMASPHVAGAAALVFSCLNGASNDSVRQRLRATAQDLGPAGRDNLYGFGLVRADLACQPSSTTPPDAPSELTVTGTTRNSISLAWKDNSTDEDLFELERCTTSCSVVSLGPNSTTYTDSGLTRKTSYTYKVRACNGAGCSAWSNSVTATTK